MRGLRRPCAPRLASRHLSIRRAHDAPRVVFSGIQPTGTPHVSAYLEVLKHTVTLLVEQLGNYLGALSNWVQMQKAAKPSDTLIYSIVGLHAITVPQDPKQLRRDRLDALASLLAIGIEPKRSILFHQDEVQEHAELSWILGCSAPLGRLSRMTAYKSKLVSLESSSNDEKLGLFSYPVLQAADILLYKATHVPVGEDQRQHLELTRDLAQVFNQRFAPSTFPLPETISTPAKRVLSLRDPTQKMSKSAPNPKSRIVLSDSTEDVVLKIRKAVTDSDTHISYDSIRRPGISNLLRILHECNRLAAAASAPPISSSSEPHEAETLPPTSTSSHGLGTHTYSKAGSPGSAAPIDQNQSTLSMSNSQPSGSARPSTLSPEDRTSDVVDTSSELDAELHALAASFSRAGARTPQFKEVVAEAVEACIAPIRADFTRYRADERYLRTVAAEGARRAREIAQRTMVEVKAKIGLD